MSSDMESRAQDQIEGSQLTFVQMVEEMDQLRKDLAEREAETVSLRGYLHQINNMSGNTTINNACAEALSTQPSTSYLEQWDKERYGEPVHWRAVLSDTNNNAFNATPTICGFSKMKEAEQFIAEKKDFKGWSYNLEPLYARKV